MHKENSIEEAEKVESSMKITINQHPKAQITNDINNNYD